MGLAKVSTSPVESSSFAGPMWRTTSVSACSIRLMVVSSESSPQPAIRPTAERTTASWRTYLALITGPSPRGGLDGRSESRLRPRHRSTAVPANGDRPARTKRRSHRAAWRLWKTLGDERRASEIRPREDRARAPGRLGEGRSLRDPRPRGRQRGGLHQAVESLHLREPAHGTRARLLDRRCLCPLPPRPRRRRAARVRLRRLRPARRDGGDRPRRAAGGLGGGERRADARADEAARLLLRLRTYLLQLRREPIPLVAMALRHPAGGGVRLPRRRHGGLVRQLLDDACRAPGRGRPLLALPQQGEADPTPHLVPQGDPFPRGERRQHGALRALERPGAEEPALYPRPHRRRRARPRRSRRLLPHRLHAAPRRRRRRPLRARLPAPPRGRAVGP